MPLTLDVVIPTYNRAALLRKTLESLLRFPPPPNLRARVLVINNNSADRTEQVVADFLPAFGGRLHCIREYKQGLSHARNAGIRAGAGDIIAFLDDDEEITQSWFHTIAQAFEESDVAYIGGPMLPNWEATPPPWLPVWELNGVLSIFDSSPVSANYGPGFNGMPVGGNCAFRRKVFEKVGLYRRDLGRSSTGLASCEDHDLFLRLQAAGLRGVYMPTMAILHRVPAERLTANYYRRWVTGQSISQGRMGAIEYGVPYWIGIPRYRFGSVVRGALRLAKDAVSGRITRKQLFLHELAWRQLFGLLYGTHRPAGKGLVRQTRVEDPAEAQQCLETQELRQSG